MTLDLGGQQPVAVGVMQGGDVIGLDHAGQGKGRVMNVIQAALGQETEQVAGTPDVPEVAQVRRPAQGTGTAVLRKQSQRLEEPKLTADHTAEVGPDTMAAGVGRQEGAQGVVEQLPTHAVGRHHQRLSAGQPRLMGGQQTAHPLTGSVRRRCRRRIV
jgi:hypothetical protein